MATVYQPTQSGAWIPRREYETEEMTVQDAIESVIGCRGDWLYNTEYRVLDAETAGLHLYGATSVMIQRENVDENGVYGDYEDYLIIAE